MGLYHDALARMVEREKARKGDPSATAKDKDPKGGLSAAGRRKFGVQAGVKSYSTASEKDKKRWIAWAMRFTKTPRPLKDDSGKPTRYALMFQAWGEPIPTSASAVRAVHSKAETRARQLGMGQYATKEKASEDPEWQEFEDDLDEMARELADEFSELGDLSYSERAFTVEVNGRSILTAPASTFTATNVPTEIAAEWAEQAKRNPYWQWVQGKFVEAEKANANGAYWSADGLAFGEATVQNGPLNWLHDDARIVGSLTAGKLVLPQREAAAAGERAHLVAAGVIWKNLFPEAAAIVEEASSSRNLYYSMECRADSVTCDTSSDGQLVGCGKVMSFNDSVLRTGEACEHVRERSSQRNMNNPVFLGGAIIVPPVKPAWGGATVEVIREAASVAEKSWAVGEARGMSQQDWASLIAGVTRFAHL